jgi:hypothetical protein
MDWRVNWHYYCNEYILRWNADLHICPGIVFLESDLQIIPRNVIVPGMIPRDSLESGNESKCFPEILVLKLFFIEYRLILLRLNKYTFWNMLRETIKFPYWFTILYRVCIRISSGLKREKVRRKLSCFMKSLDKTRHGTTQGEVLSMRTKDTSSDFLCRRNIFQNKVRISHWT